MLRLLADENFNNDILRGLRRRDTRINIVRVQDTPLYGAEDPLVLSWAAEENRVLLTHDAATITAYAYDRVRAGQSMPGVVEVNRSVPLRQAIDDILLLVQGSFPNEWEGQVLYLPLR